MISDLILQLLLGDRKFCGDKNAICVEDFLEILDIFFSTQNLGASIADETKGEQIKVMILQSYVSGKAKGSC